MFNSGKKIKISDSLAERIQVAVQILGCTTDEFVEKVLFAEADKVLRSTSSKTVSADEVSKIADKLKGLGYLE